MLVAAGVVGVLLGMLNYWLLVLLSLLDQFNLPTLLINVFYGGLSAWGLLRKWTR
jgi:hypothetical protein